jgi:hypothetical protein
MTEIAEHAVQRLNHCRRDPGHHPKNDAVRGAAKASVEKISISTFQTTTGAEFE